MASNLQPGETVFIPCKGVDGLEDHTSALYATRVAEIRDRSIKVTLPEGRVSDWIATAKAHRHVGIVILAVGDLQTETGLIDPLSKSVLQFCRLLLPDDSVRSLKIRSVEELRQFWEANQALYSYFVLIGHGSGESISFAVDGEVGPAEMSGIFSTATTVKTYISLCCKTGYAAFGKEFSMFNNCRGFIAPFHSVHGAVASQFVQTYFTYAFLEGETTRVAFRHARKGVAGSSSFRLWQGGELTA